MAIFVRGSKKYEIRDILPNTVFTIHSSVFKGVRQSVADGCMEDLMELAITGARLAEGKNVPESFSPNLIKEDVVHGYKDHNNKSQVAYLKQYRKYWEDRYDFAATGWFVDFGFFIEEIEGKVGDEWYVLYEIVRGPLPDHFPPNISFNIMMENIWDWKIYKEKTRVFREYFANNPDSISKLLQYDIPDNLPYNHDIGLDFGSFVNEAIRIRLKEKDKAAVAG